MLIVPIYYVSYKVISLKNIINGTLDIICTGIFGSVVERCP